MSTRKTKQQASGTLAHQDDVNTLLLPNYCWHDEDDSLMQAAIGVARKLIDQYESGPHFYANLDAAVLSTWLEEDTPELMAGLREEGTFDRFQKQLSLYCERLSVAGALADSFLHETLNYAQDGYWDFDVERFFPGLLRRIQLGRVRKLEQLPTIIATLVDRFECNRTAHYRDNVNICFHAQLYAEGWDWCDLAQVKAANDTTAFLLRKEQYPRFLSSHTNERQVFVLNAPQRTSTHDLSSKTAHWQVDVEIAEPGKAIAGIRLAAHVPAIPFFENLSTLKLFRQYIPVVYLFDDAPPLLVEYPFSWMADGAWFTRDALRIEDSNSAEDMSWTEDGHVDALIREICPMPLGAGPLKRAPVYSGPFNDSWPEFPE
ncbi:hypothetical protein H3V53_34105 [Paraburkholderia bengalensis]|uniref:Uncharacterized protein n=1 Tax=Paraburkholderia bengalensis TaxID=2747562 RepID=A0ABU8J2M1_9BURK